MIANMTWREFFSANNAEHLISDWDYTMNKHITLDTVIRDTSQDVCFIFFKCNNGHRWGSSCISPDNVIINCIECNH